MNIILIDDDTGILQLTKLLLTQMGHNVTEFANPTRAVGALQNSRVDLVISDIQMPELDGFDVAERVARTCGTSPPKVLLISGSQDVRSRLRAAPVSTVIGLLPKPFGRKDLSRVVSLVEKSRSCCPGTVAPFCPYVQPPRGANPADAATSALCHTPTYAECPHYAEHCGRTLRTWVETPGSALASMGEMIPLTISAHS